MFMKYIGNEVCHDARRLFMENIGNEEHAQTFSSLFFFEELKNIDGG
jgi:hypothetical protein